MKVTFSVIVLALAALFMVALPVLALSAGPVSGTPTFLAMELVSDRAVAAEPSIAEVPVLVDLDAKPASKWTDVLGHLVSILFGVAAPYLTQGVRWVMETFVVKAIPAAALGPLNMVVGTVASVLSSLVTGVPMDMAAVEGGGISGAAWKLRQDAPLEPTPKRNG